MNHRHATFTSYAIGFGASVLLTVAAFVLVVGRLLPTTGLVLVVVILAVVQLIVQLVFFLHLGQEDGPRWNLQAAGFAVLVITILVGGSLWIMSNLDYNMTMSPDQNQDVRDDKGF